MMIKATTTPPANTTDPLIQAGTPVANLPAAQWGLLPSLVGNWHSAAGSPSYGYNMMPLPAHNVQPQGFLLKNFSYYEQMTISALAANPRSGAGEAPNRGGLDTTNPAKNEQFQQGAYPLFYAQRVYINMPATPPNPMANPPENTLIHAENGSWLHLVYEPQPKGAYAPPNDGPVPAGEGQNPHIAYVKQVSVPHGNSILAPGSAKTVTGSNPTYPTANKSLEPYTTYPSTEDPNSVLGDYLKALNEQGLQVTSFDQFSVSTSNSAGAVTNIQFEKGHADVIRFDTTFWILTLSDGSKRLQYSQTIFMNLLVNEAFTDFLHITANSLEPVPAR